MSDDVLIPRLGHNNLFNSCVWETEHFFSLFRTFRTVLPRKRHWRWLHSFSHTHARSHNNTASSSSLHKMWTMNIVESVVGCFVGLWCLFVIRCETVMVSGVYRKWVYCLVCRDIQHSYIIFAYTCCCSILLIYIYIYIYTGYPPSHPFAICIKITSINWLTYIYSHFLVLTLPHTGPNTKERSRWDSTFTLCH